MLKKSTLIATATAAATVGLLATSLNLVQAQTNADKPSGNTAGSNQTVGATTDNMSGTTGASRPLPATPPTTPAATASTDTSNTTSASSTPNADSSMPAARSDRN